MIILVVKDEAIITTMIALTLHDSGHQVLGPAASAEMVLRLAGQTTPDLVLLDINQHDWDERIALARTLRARHAAPVLFLSAETQQARANRDAALGLIGKPFDSRIVLTAVRLISDLMEHGRSPYGVPHELELF